MDILNSNNNLYGWLTSLIRRRGRRKLNENNSIAQLNSPNTDDDLHSITTLQQNNVKETKIGLNYNNHKINQNAINNSVEGFKSSNEFYERKSLIKSQPQQEGEDKDEYFILKGFKNKMEKKDQKSEGDDDQSIEEDIEEVISGGSIQESISKDNSSKAGAIGGVRSTKGVNGNKSVGGVKGTTITTKTRQLFDIDDDDFNDHFKIDDDQLSGKKLAEHFKIDLNNSQQSKSTISSHDDDDDDDNVRSSTSNISSSNKDKRKRKLLKNIEEHESLTTNQSTTKDVSELFGESSMGQDEEEIKDLYTKSLDLNNATEISYEQRDCKSLETAVKYWKLPFQKDSIGQNSKNNETTHPSFEITLDDKNLSSLASDIDINNESQINKILSDTPQDIATGHHSNVLIEEPISIGTESIEDIINLKEKILAMTPVTKPLPITTTHFLKDLTTTTTTTTTTMDHIDQDQAMTVKQMERIQGDFSKEILEDITEESEKLSPNPERISNDFDSIVSLNMIQMLENNGKDIGELIINRETISLDSGNRRDCYSNNGENRDSLKEFPPSGRDSCSLATTSTEYRTILDDMGTKFYDYNIELARRDQLIDDLRKSLEQSVQMREKLQQQSEKLSSEIQDLRKQLQYDINNDKQYWPRDQESTGQRLSEISLDLVSESDEDLDRNLLTDEEKMTASSRNSKERQLSDSTGNILDACDPEIYPVSKHIEQFQKYLNTDELRIFFMVQKKFDDFLSQEIEKTKIKCDSDIKMFIEQLENEKHERDFEINRLQQLLISVKNGSTELAELRRELESIHAREMEDLRKYFEKKCADLEKQYSEEVFSQKSQRDSNDTNSDVSDKENFPEEYAVGSKEGSPRKKTREELYASPSHRQITPTTISQTNEQLPQSVGPFGDCKVQEMEPQITIEEVEGFYKEKIQEITRKHDETVKKLTKKLKRFETKYAADEFMNEMNDNEIINTTKTTTSTTGIGDRNISSPNDDDDDDDDIDSDNDNDNNVKRRNENDVIDEDEVGTSTYLIIDQDDHVDPDINESQEICKIAAEYERRLIQQVALAKEDILHELQEKLQALLSESTTDDQHWPPEFILLREKFTAKSQLEIAQLQMKHEEEMSRLKLDFEKQLNRKIKRNSTFDSSRDLDAIVNERENLRELSNTLRNILSEFVKYVSVSETDMNNTFLEELHNFAINQQQQQQNPNNLSGSGDDGGGGGGGGGGDGGDFDGYQNISENNLNNSNQLLQSTIITKKLRLAPPDISSLLTLIEDPQLVEFIGQNPGEISTFNLKDCVDKLKLEANHLLQLSEDLINKRKNSKDDNDYDDDANSGDFLEKNDSCEEEDGLKSRINRTPKKILRAKSFNEEILKENKNHNIQRNILLSLPPDLNRINQGNESIFETDVFNSSEPLSELNFQVHDLRNRLVKSETDRYKLQEELDATIKKNIELGMELNALREQLEQLDSQKEDYSEGYGLGELKSPPRLRAIKKTTSFSQLQEKARNILSTPTKMSDNTTLLLQMIEDFCREGDKVVEDGKKDREDLQSQIDAADKQLKATRQFLEEQATERELERDEFVKEIENLKNLVREKEKERSSLEIASKEITVALRMVKKAEQMEQQIKDLQQQVSELEARKNKLEIELKASIDKIFVLRDIISDLETQVQKKALNEHVMNEKVKELEAFIASQNRSTDELQQEVESLKSEIGQGYQERIAQLQEQLRNSRPSTEQSLIVAQITEQLRDIEITLDQKTKTLEAIHQSISSVSASTSPTEDVSVQAAIIQPLSAATINITPQGSPMHPSPKHHSLPIEEVQRVFDKLGKHTRVEEAAIKRIRDLEMQIGNIRIAYGELQNERDVLQERMSEQMLRISSLQSKLEEQRRRAEELQRQGTSDLNIRIHDLQNEIMDLKETLSARDKQIANLNNQLEQSKGIIDRQEAELSLGIQGDRSAIEKLEQELKARTKENERLKIKIKSEMINKLALPDLMETMLADKNEEIDHLREQLEKKDRELQGILAINLNQISSEEKEKDPTKNDDNEAKHSGRTLSDIVSISEYDEPDVIRRAPIGDMETPLMITSSNVPDQTLETSKHPNTTTATTLPTAAATTTTTGLFTSGNQTMQQTFDQPYYFQQNLPQKYNNNNNVSTIGIIPRQINFSGFSDDSKIKKSTPKMQEHSEHSATDDVQKLKTNLETAKDEIENLKLTLDNVESEKNSKITELNTELQNKLKLCDELLAEKNAFNKKLVEFGELISKNDELKIELTKRTSELSKLEKELRDHQFETNQINEELRLKTIEINGLKMKLNEVLQENESLSKKLNESVNSSQQIDNLTEQINMLSNIIKEKDEVLTKQEKNLLNSQHNEQTNQKRIAELENHIQSLVNANKLDDVKGELNSTRTQLSEKMLLYEKSLLDIQSYQKDIEKLKESIKEKDNIISTLTEDSKNLKDIISGIQNRLNGSDSINELKRKLREENDRNSVLEQKNSMLENELEKLRSQNSDNSKPFSLDEITAQVEKELNYSAQLDTNILKAIESEDETDFKTDNEKRDLLNQLQLYKSQLEMEKVNCEKIQQLLNAEKQYSQDIQQQDADVIQAMRIRLEDAMQKEQELHMLLDEERDRCERLTTQISVLQRTEARKSSMLLKSPTNSPRKSPRSSDSESEVAERLKSEIKLLQAQNDRERDRVNDLQNTLEREKERYKIESKERIEYAEKLKREMDKIVHEKELAEQETDHLQERLTLALREIETLESRISVLQEQETRRAHRRDRERTETIQNAADLQELKTKLINIESERDLLNQTVAMLRNDIERGAQREAKLAEALTNSSGGDSSLPQQFLQKMKEMNNLLAENTKENRQMVETIQVLIDERKMLQKKVEDLETDNRGQNYNELEERANHLFGKYLRVESHRKALVHQKRYLLIVLRSYEESEAKALAAFSSSTVAGNITNLPRRNLFKTVALAIIAIQRMKFIVKRWHSGKRLVAKSIFNIPIQKKPLTTTNSAPPAQSLSPPCRDTSMLPAMLQTRGFTLVDPALKPLQAPTLISEYSQKFDWSRLKK